jgi:dipeptide/tripeptide permease
LCSFLHFQVILSPLRIFYNKTFHKDYRFLCHNSNKSCFCLLFYVVFWTITQNPIHLTLFTPIQSNHRLFGFGYFLFSPNFLNSLANLFLCF